MLSTDPAEPIDRIDPRLAIERNESSDHNDNPPMPGIVARTQAEAYTLATGVT
ncbi:hypothetical protein ACFPJ1_42915 [Kribbella qitaiheensis]|uniref:hypothetical protein n=1 Tax=Kribbella qitaiheensis TaxID=1544730 RepID=UPI00361A6256